MLKRMGTQSCKNNNSSLLSSTLPPLAFSLLLFILLSCLSAIILPGASFVKVIVELDHDDTIDLHSHNGFRKTLFDERYAKTSKIIKKGKKEAVVFALSNQPIKKLRLDFGKLSGTVKLFKIKITSHFAQNVVLAPSEIYRLFRAAGKESTIELKKDHVELVFKHNDTQLISNSRILKVYPFLLFGPQLLISILFFLVIQKFNFRLLPAITDINKKTRSSGENIDALDGLRAIAITMVVADHTWGLFKGLGAGGVWIFFALSGFLLIRPFIHQPDRVFSKELMSVYALKRAARILPAYYFYIIIIYLLSTRFNDAIRHFLFLQGSGHLWVVPQLVVFYLLLPTIVAVNYILFRNRFWPTLLALICLMFLANKVFDRSVISLFGMNHIHLRLFAGIFIAGIIFSFAYHRFYLPLENKLKQKQTVQVIFSLISISLLLFFILGSTEYLWGGKQIFAQKYFQWFGIAAGALIFSILAAGDTKFNRLLSILPLRTIGLVSFSLYLFHPLILNVIRKAAFYYSGYDPVGFPLFIATLSVSYFVSCFIYTYIERPFLHLNKTQTTT